MLPLLLLVWTSTAVLAIPVEKPLDPIPGEPPSLSQPAPQEIDGVKELDASYQLHARAKQTRLYLGNISVVFMALAIVYFSHTITRYREVKAEGDDLDERSTNLYIHMVIKLLNSRGVSKSSEVTCASIDFHKDTRMVGQTF
ncbi:uncharacterized protein EMH_0091290 [Eimeria mitis]|uniref:Uncharacterized protein n=1 Tax=Eimeria mitis TaxID=44415 RepID=U6KEY1_9EIME|nr:uncharacterized protein EMH_0091290 [Eimeria mitis]CDJ36590.1 hypothetical protein, conserved [Eimeria mitis]